jgi:hypothetical protein
MLWTVPVWMQYLEDRAVMERAPEKVTLVCEREDTHEFLRACWKGMDVVSEAGKEKEEADLVFEFNPEVAYRLTEKVEKHIVESYGVQLGTMPFMKLPPVAMEIGQEERGLVSIAFSDKDRWEWPHWKEFDGLLSKEEVPIHNDLVETLGWKWLLHSVSKASVVVGVRGAATLMAAAMGKIVMELSPEEGGHRNWMPKWENKKYRMIYGKLEDMTADFVWTRTRGLVEELARRGEMQWASRSSLPEGFSAPVVEG